MEDFEMQSLMEMYIMNINQICCTAPCAFFGTPELLNRNQVGTQISLNSCFFTTSFFRARFEEWRWTSSWVNKDYIFWVSMIHLHHQIGHPVFCLPF